MSSRLRLGELKFGAAAAEAEATLDGGSFLESVYVDSLEILRRVYEGKVLIGGRKGTGKSAFAWWLSLKKQSDRFVHLMHFKANEIEQIIQKQEERRGEAFEELVWEWMLLCSLVKLVLQDQSIEKRLKEPLETFYSQNRGYCGPTSLELTESIRKAEYGVKVYPINKILELSGKRHVQTTEVKAPFFQIIEPLREALIEVLSKGVNAKNEYFVVIDDLDQGYTNSKNQQRAIVSLMRVISRMMPRFSVHSIKFFPLVLIRTDIMSQLMEHADTNKIWAGFGQKISWYDHSTYLRNEEEVPLRKLIESRVRYSYESADMPIPENLFDELFDNDFDGRVPFKLLLDKTLYRPRDVIEYLHMIKERYKNAYRISRNMIEECFGQFSAFLVDEWRNELSASFAPVVVDEIFEVLRELGSQRFKISDVERIYGDTSRRSWTLTPEELIFHAFQFSLVCNLEGPPDKPIVTWNHRGDESNPVTVNLDAEFGINYGFQKRFAASDRKSGRLRSVFRF